MVIWVCRLPSQLIIINMILTRFMNDICFWILFIYPLNGFQDIRDIRDIQIFFKKQESE
jgi:hypothetical protein